MLLLKDSRINLGYQESNALISKYYLLFQWSDFLQVVKRIYEIIYLKIAIRKL